MSKSSGISKKPSVQPNVSPKPKDKFNSREAGIAMCIIIIVVGVTILLTAGFRNNYELDLKNATAAADAKKAEYDAKLKEVGSAYVSRQAELDAREAKLKTKEAELNTKEAELETRAGDLEAEKKDFYDRQARVKELCDALSLELAQE